MQFGHAWSCPPRLIVSTYRKILCLSACKKSTSSHPSFLRHCKDITDLLFWVLWACLDITSKITLSACRKSWCLSSCKKSCLSPTSFLKYYKDIIKMFFGYFEHAWPHPPKAITATWLVKNILGNDSRKKLCQA